VKPANIMINTAGAVKVMDFGIARTLADTTGAGRLTQTAAVLGTAAYLSPEQASGETVDARSDVYSLGCVLYEMLTGSPPFVGETPVAVAYQHVRKDPVAPSQHHDGISAELDAVVLKSLAKNPENRYQSAAAMRTDLIRVHSGQTPEAPKVFTDADRTDLLGSPSTNERQQLTGFAPGRRRDDSMAGRSPRRWLLAAGAVIVLGIVGIAAINAFVDRTHPVRVPDLHGQDLQNAVATLQNLGFKIRGPIERPDVAVPSGQVINTDPGADTALAGGDEVTINVSSGPERRRVPDCSTVTVDTCVRRLADAGFDRPKMSPIPSSTVPEKLVVDTVPAAGQLAAVTADITIEVSSGPETRRVPDLSGGQTVDQATTNLRIAGFPIVVTAPVDSLLPSGQVVATDPPAGTDLSVRSAVTLKVSRGNQFPMPNLIDKTYLEVMPILQGYGYVGQPINGGDVPGPDANKFRVVKQDPPAGAGVNRDGTITLNYGS